jgi:hypothetical protein
VVVVVDSRVSVVISAYEDAVKASPTTAHRIVVRVFRIDSPLSRWIHGFTFFQPYL